jgi:hypothetical protein
MILNYGSNAMGEAAVDQNQLEQIGSYVKRNMAQWIREQNLYPFSPPDRGLDKELFERMVTVEQQLKFQNEKLELMMKQSGEHFESINKRFNRLYTFLTGIFLTMLAGFIPLIIKSF